jgi:thiol:disulfide interchange protein DsbA
MLKIKRFPLLLVSVLGYLTILLTFSGSVTPAYGQGSVRGIPSFGNGPYEVIIFSDYFCPPCKRIDAKAEPLIKELMKTRKVKIIFADVPFHRETPIYARYYLYAVNAGLDNENVFRIRKVLFKAAQEKNIKTQPALAAYLKEEKINLKPYDEKPVFALLSQMIRQNGIDQTPTCVIKYSITGANKYIGDEEVWNGLMQLKNMLKAEKK